MTGEMHQSEVTRENFPLHFAIADAINGTVHAFDKYQGPFITASGHKLWVCSEDGCDAYLYDERTDKKSIEFPYDDDETAVALALQLTMEG